MIELELSVPGSAPEVRRFTQDVVVIGRSSGAQLCIPDRAISRQHARIERSGSGWQLQDLGSRNGTLLNGRRVEGATGLDVHDVITLGAARIAVRSLGTPPPSPSEQSILRPAHEVLRESSSAVERTVESLERDVERLRILNEVHQALGRSLSLEELLELMMDRVCRHLQPEEAAIYLGQPDRGFTAVSTRSSRGRSDPPRLSTHLLHEVVEKGMTALVHDVRIDERFRQAQSLLTEGVRSLAAAPLLGPEENLGMLVVESTAAVRSFNDADVALLASLASVAALWIRNLNLSAAAAERARLEREIALAREIQVALLPSVMPAVRGYELHGGNVPSRVVSGDFYAVVERSDGREVVLVLADVSGKGIAAALLTASLEALLAMPITGGGAPDEICTTVSRLLWSRTPPQKFATAIVAVLDRTTGHLTYASAGHNPMLLLSGAAPPRWLAATGPPLGVLPAATFERGVVDLAPADLLVLYTDGFPEAEAAGGEEYGGERLAALCRAHARDPLPRLAAALEADLARHTGDAAPADDRTLLLLRRLPHEG